MAGGSAEGISDVSVGLFAASASSFALVSACWLSILADRTYELGDFLQLENGTRGRVTQIGLRSTRMVTLDDVEIIVPNTAMATATITNASGGPGTPERLPIEAQVAYGSDLAKVRQVRSGQSINNKDLRSFVVDFDLSLFGGEMPESKVTTSAGTIVHAYLKTLADQGVLRLAFEFEPGDATVADLQALLTDKQGVALSESWLARWSA